MFVTLALCQRKIAWGKTQNRSKTATRNYKKAKNNRDRDAHCINITVYSWSRRRRDPRPLGPCVGTKPWRPPLRSSRLDRAACLSRAVVSALGQEMARSMCHFQVRRRSKPHRGFGKKAPAHPFPTHLLSHLRGSPSRESALGFGPRVRPFKLSRCNKKSETRKSRSPIFG